MPLLPKPDQHGRYIYPDGCMIAQPHTVSLNVLPLREPVSPFNDRWVARWKDGTPLRDEDDTLSHFDTAEEAALILADAGEGPASMPDYVRLADKHGGVHADDPSPRPDVPIPSDGGPQQIPSATLKQHLNLWRILTEGLHGAIVGGIRKYEKYSDRLQLNDTEEEALAEQIEQYVTNHLSEIIDFSD